MKIGFIGLGIMGKPMAKNLLKAGYEVWVNNRTHAPMDELAACGGHPATQQEIGENCDLILTMLPNSPQVKEVMLGGDGVAGSLEAQFKLNPVRLSMDAASFPVAAKDMSILRGLDAGLPYLPSLPTPAPVLEKIKAAMKEAGLI